MPTKSKFNGYDLVKIDEPFKVGDYYYPAPYSDLSSEDFDVDGWCKVGAGQGPRNPGQTFAQRHKTHGFTVIRKSSNKTGLPTRLAMSRSFSKPLPLP